MHIGLCFYDKIPALCKKVQEKGVKKWDKGEEAASEMARFLYAVFYSLLYTFFV